MSVFFTKYKPSFALLSLFTFLFLFHTTPYSQTMSHEVVHLKGIPHTHHDADDHHTQHDHTSGKVKAFDSVSLTLKKLSSGIFKNYPPVLVLAVLTVPLAIPHASKFIDDPALLRPPSLKELSISHLNKAPPVSFI